MNIVPNEFKSIAVIKRKNYNLLVVWHNIKILN